MGKITLDVPDEIGTLTMEQKERVMVDLFRGLGAVLTTREEIKLSPANYLVGMTMALGAMFGLATLPEQMEETTADTIKLFRHWFEKGQDARKKMGLDETKN